MLECKVPGAHPLLSSTRRKAFLEALSSAVFSSSIVLYPIDLLTIISSWIKVVVSHPSLERAAERSCIMAASIRSIARDNVVVGFAFFSIFPARLDAFFSIFQNLHVVRSFAPLETQFFAKKYLILQSQKIFFEGKGSVLQSNFAILWFVVTTEGLYPNHDVSNVCFSKSKAICVEHFDEFQKQF